MMGTDPHGGRCEGLDFLRNSIGHTGVPKIRRESAGALETEAGGGTHMVVPPERTTLL